MIVICVRCKISFEHIGNGWHKRRFCEPCHPIAAIEASRRRNAQYRLANRDRIRERRQQPDRLRQMQEATRRCHDRARFDGLRDAVLARDGYRCVECGHPWESGSRRIVVHHLDHDRAHNEMSNLVTMCRACHPKIHGASRPSVRAKMSAAGKRAWAEGRQVSHGPLSEEHRLRISAGLRAWHAGRAAMP
jgi:5-methylcytosine-specific restriction endonuclease McrA